MGKKCVMATTQRVQVTFLLLLHHTLFFAAFWCLFGLGNTTSANSRLERFQVRGHVSLQRGHHVRARGGCEFRPAGPPERLFHHHFHFHHILHDGDVVSGLCAKGNTRL